jgi:hypothetical protein
MNSPKANKMIQMLHPEGGKRNFKISEEKYDVVRGAILHCLRASGELTHTELLRCVSNRLAAGFDGSISWYVEAVKLDLEARGEITRTFKLKQQLLSLSRN